MADPGALVEDDLLRLVLMCTHPALAPEAASALTLRLVLGVPTPDIARLFLVPEATMAARLTRAKKRIVGAGIPFGVPDASVLPDRLDTVAQTAYLAFTAGYSPGTGADLLRAELSGEAIRLVRVGARRCVPTEPVLVALLALMLFQHSRRDARVRDGRLVLLADQDRDAVAPRRDRRGPRPARRTGAARSDHGAGCGLHPAGAHRRRARARAVVAARPGGSAIVGLYDLLLDARADAERAAGTGGRRGRGARTGRGAGRPGGHRDPVDAPGRRRTSRAAGPLRSTHDAARAAYDQAIAACRNDVERAHLRERASVARLSLGDLLLLGEHGQPVLDDEAARPVLVGIDADAGAGRHDRRPCR